MHFFIDTGKDGFWLGELYSHTSCRNTPGYQPAMSGNSLWDAIFVRQHSKRLRVTFKSSAGWYIRI